MTLRHETSFTSFSLSPFVQSASLFELFSHTHSCKCKQNVQPSVFLHDKSLLVKKRSVRKWNKRRPWVSGQSKPNFLRLKVHPHPYFSSFSTAHTRCHNIHFELSGCCVRNMLCASSLCDSDTRPSFSMMEGNAAGLHTHTHTHVHVLLWNLFAFPTCKNNLHVMDGSRLVV